jgi:hypothetical protein
VQPSRSSAPDWRLVYKFLTYCPPEDAPSVGYEDEPGSIARLPGVLHRISNCFNMGGEAGSLDVAGASFGDARFSGDEDGSRDVSFTWRGMLLFGKFANCEEAATAEVKQAKLKSILFPRVDPLKAPPRSGPCWLCGGTTCITGATILLRFPSLMFHGDLFDEIAGRTLERLNDEYADWLLDTAALREEHERVTVQVCEAGHWWRAGMSKLRKHETRTTRTTTSTGSALCSDVRRDVDQLIPPVMDGQYLSL